MRKRHGVRLYKRAVEASGRTVRFSDGTELDVSAVIWATGFRPDYSWLRAPVFDLKGRLRHHGGLVAPGLYALGLNFMRRRKSSFIHGAEDDVREIAAHLFGHLDRAAASTRRRDPVLT